MSPLANLTWLTALLSAAFHPVGAQTIGDYSRSQRTVIEAAIARNAARVQAPPPVGSQPPVPSLPALPSLPSHPSTASVSGGGNPSPGTATIDPEPDPSLVVTGVIISSAQQLAEVEVDGAAYLLAAGQAVPGTGWRVEKVSADRVLLIDPRRRGHSAGQRNFSLVSLGR